MDRRVRSTFAVKLHQRAEVERRQHVSVAVDRKLTAEVVRQVSEGQHDLGHAMSAEPIELAFDQWLVRDRQQGLRRAPRQRPQPRPLAPDQEDGFHGVEVVGVGAVDDGSLDGGAKDDVVVLPSTFAHSGLLKANEPCPLSLNGLPLALGGTPTFSPLGTKATAITSPSEIL